MFTMKNFIFGYGSLICPQSRAITAPSLSNSTAEPVIVNHIERTWSARINRRRRHSGLQKMAPSSVRGWTPVGVRFRRGAVCNGVLICIDEEELFRFDEREVGYNRQRIDVADIHRHVDSDILINESMSLWPTESTDQENCDDMTPSRARDNLDPGGVKCSECRLVFERASVKRRKITTVSGTIALSEECEEIAVWVYVQNENLPADRAYPISQSYVDIIMRGCLSISRDFARRFLETTHGWRHDEWLDQNDGDNTNNDGEDDESNDDRVSTLNRYIWVNDRHAPIYCRADFEYSLMNGKEIDELIQEHHPRALKLRVLAM